MGGIFMQSKHNQALVVNALIAALYVALYFVAPQFAYGPIQFRVSEGLNHLNVYHKNYKWGVVLGVFLSNFYGFMTGLGWYDIVFGTAHTLLSFLLCDWVYRYLKTDKQKLAATTLIFSMMIFIIAFELNLAFELPFWATYASLFVSEVIILALTAPLIYLINKRLYLAKMFNH